MVVIADYNLVKKGFNSKNNELMGRPVTGFSQIMLQNGKDVAFTNHGPVWASLRRVAHSAVRYAMKSNLIQYIVLIF